MNYLYGVAQIRELERLAIKEYNISEPQLMLRAGNAAFKVLLDRYPHTKKIAVVCGSGNNGGDGWVVARLAKERGLQVTVYPVGEIDDKKDVVSGARALGVSVVPFVEGTSLGKGNARVDVIVDALLGIGLQGDVRRDCVAAIRAMSDARKVSNSYILSLDCPSGIDTDTGAVLGCAVRADVTVTFLALKKGLFTGSAPGYVGELFFDDLSLPRAALSCVSSQARLIEPERLPARKREAHKGSFGHVLVIGGDCGMSGAVRMAAEAAARVGAGLVSVATRPEHASTINSTRPELMVHSVQKRDDLEPLIASATVLIIGPGLGLRDWSKDLLQATILSNLPKVIDADGLNLLSGLSYRTDNWVLTPHPGEAARLLGVENAALVQADRFEAVTNLQKNFGGVCVLKGAGTLVASPAGEIFVCQKGNPGMATGGMGDVLSGVIGGLIAQGLPIEQAATTGVYIHASAADKAAKEGGERGLLAMDVVKQLRSIVNSLVE